MPIKYGEIVAAGSYSSLTGAAVSYGQRGGTVAYNGVGDCTVTLDAARGGLDVTDCVALLGVRGATLMSIQAVDLTDATKQIITRGVGLAAAEAEVFWAYLKIMNIDGGVIRAAGSYNGALGAGAVAYGQRGGVMTRMAGAGDYTLTLDRGINTAEGAIICTVGPGAAAATDLHTRVVHTSDTVKHVFIETLAGVATDADLKWAVFDQNQCQKHPQIVSCGSIVGDGTVPVGRGAVPARTGAGTYTVTHDRLLNAAGEYAMFATAREATTRAIRVANTSDQVKTVLTQIAAASALTNSGFSWANVRIV